MALRFHAMSATPDFASNSHNWGEEKWSSDKHQQYADA
jgi:hypothetical protein